MYNGGVILVVRNVDCVSDSLFTEIHHNRSYPNLCYPNGAVSLSWSLESS